MTVTLNNPDATTTEGGPQLSAAEALRSEWNVNPRWAGVERTYSAEDVVQLRGSVVEEHTLARRGAEKLWEQLQTKPFTRALGALTGNQAVQQVRGGLEAIYLSGWQVAADANLSGQTYPDQSLYPANSVPAVVRRINNALMRADQIDWSNGENGTDYLVPIVADAEAGFGGPLNAFELMKSMIVSGAAGVHWEDQLASEKKCGHLGGKVLVPTAQHIRTLNAARLAADTLNVPSLVIARTDALAADLLTSDVDPIDQEFTTGERTSEGFFRVRNGIEPVLAFCQAWHTRRHELDFEIDGVVGATGDSRIIRVAATSDSLRMRRHPGAKPRLGGDLGGGRGRHRGGQVIDPVSGLAPGPRLGWRRQRIRQG